MEFNQKNLCCNKGHLIPSDSYRTNKNGQVLTTPEGIPLKSGGMIACPVCAAEVYVPPGIRRMTEGQPRNPKGQIVPEQTTINEIMGDIPMIKID
jgi:hypothetical protein